MRFSGHAPRDRLHTLYGDNNNDMLKLVFGMTPRGNRVRPDKDRADDNFRVVRNNVMRAPSTVTLHGRQSLRSSVGSNDMTSTPIGIIRMPSLLFSLSRQYRRKRRRRSPATVTKRRSRKSPRQTLPRRQRLENRF